MADLLTPKEAEEVSKATSLAEHGNCSRLVDLVHDEKDIATHNKIINAMLNLNQKHVQTMELQESLGLKPDHVNHLKLEEKPQKDANGDLLITRSISGDGRTLYKEIYNSTKKSYVDSGSCTRPTGIIPEFIPHNK